MVHLHAAYRTPPSPSEPPDELRTEVVQSLRPTPTRRLLQSPGTGIRLVREVERQMRRQDRLSSPTWFERILPAIVGGYPGARRVSVRALRAVLRAIERSGNKTTQQLLQQALLNWVSRVQGSSTRSAGAGVSFSTEALWVVHELRLTLDRALPMEREAVRQLTRTLEVVVRARIDLERAKLSFATQRDAPARARWMGRQSLERRTEVAELESEYQAYARKVFEILLSQDEEPTWGWSLLAGEPSLPPT